MGAGLAWGDAGGGPLATDTASSWTECESEDDDTGRVGNSASTGFLGCTMVAASASAFSRARSVRMDRMDMGRRGLDCSPDASSGDAALAGSSGALT